MSNYLCPQCKRDQYAPQTYGEIDKEKLDKELEDRVRLKKLNGAPTFIGSFTVKMLDWAMDDILNYRCTRCGKLNKKGKEAHKKRECKQKKKLKTQEQKS